MIDLSVVNYHLLNNMFVLHIHIYILIYFLLIY